MDNNEAQNHYDIGLAYFQKGEYFKAFDELLTTIDLDSTYQNKPYNHPLFEGLIHETRNEFEDALDIYLEILENEPNFAIVYCRIGYCYYYLGDLKEAIVNYSSAIDLDDTISAVFYNRAIAFEDLSDELKDEISEEEFDEYLMKAINDYTIAIELEPEDYQSVNNRGLLHYYLGDYEKAISDLTISIEAYPSRAVSYDFRGCAFRENGALSEALKDFNKAIELDSDDPIIFHNRALVWLELDEQEKAIEDLNKALKLDPNYEDAKMILDELD